LPNKIKALGLGNADNNILKAGQNKKEVSGNDFIPIISLDKSYKDPKKKYRAVYKGNVGGKKTVLSEHLSSRTQLLEEVKITVPTEIRLNVRQGNSKANDKKGTITIISKGVIFNDSDNSQYDSSELSKNVMIKEIKYNSSFTIKINPFMIAKGAYIDFFANDDDWLFYSVSNVHCGRIAVTNTSNIGKRLTENIQNSPTATTSQILPSDPYEKNFPKKSFEMANKYKNPGGMCFAITMSRVSKAFKDLKISDAIKVDISVDDYIYSGTISSNIPDKYLGYGVGGAVAKNGYADLISEDEVWSGRLEEGALIQYWNDPDKKGWNEIKKSIKDKLNGINNPNFHAGHSVIFKSYYFDKEDNIIGLWCYDYSGTGRTYAKDAEYHRIFLGANLKDKK